jgi:ribosomal protein S8
LKKEGWIYDVEIIKKAIRKKNTASAFDQLKLVLKYKKSGRPMISSLKRISKPGLKDLCQKRRASEGFEQSGHSDHFNSARLDDE